MTLVILAGLLVGLVVIPVGYVAFRRLETKRINTFSLLKRINRQTKTIEAHLDDDSIYNAENFSD